MHILSKQNRSEFLATPQMIRLAFAIGADGYEPTLLVKGSTLLLKYIVLGVRIRLILAQIKNRLLYGLQVYDDENQAGIVWSILEHDEERLAFAALAQGQVCQTFLFNELAVNVAWAPLKILIGGDFCQMGVRAVTGSVNHSAFEEQVGSALEAFHLHSSNVTSPIVTFEPHVAWRSISATFITAGFRLSPFDIFTPDEGNQQEQLCIWLTDNLDPRGAYHSPQISKGGGVVRELTDVLFSHQFGSILIESKTLSILSRTNLPNRAKLMKNMDFPVGKAISQLKGGIRYLKEGYTVNSVSGGEIFVERNLPFHAVVLVPELSLLNPKMYGLELIASFSEQTNSYIHIVDVAELVRIVQASEIIVDSGNLTTPLMAFDYYLMQRAKMAVESETLIVEILLRKTEAGSTPQPELFD